ncbi:MAG: hypothetical protein K1X67_03230 [Fimbriimonadaceae bacterium]|nr:hypothetical protein [Fimbriimonadaceae bacterium]
MLGWIILAAFLGGAFGLWWTSRRRANPGFLAHAEYWVYLPEAKMPSQDAIMTRMIQANPHGAGVIGPREGLLFSDIRLHMGLAKREKNPQLFRPDLFRDRAEPTPEILARLADSVALAKLRYVSEVPIPDSRHLRFLLHAADALAELGGGTVVYDAITSRLFTAEELRDRLARSPDATGFDDHVTIAWTPLDEVSVTGMTKMGWPDLVTPRSPSDHRALILQLMEEVARRIWADGMMESIELEAYDDRFVASVQRMNRDLAVVNIRRFNAP